MGSTRVLVIGNGGREHALVWKLASERAVSDIVCAPGNAGISRLARCIPVDPADPHAVAAIARREEIDFTIVGPELPLSRGVADVFAAEGDLLFGPTQRAARLESSKVFAKEFMQRCNVPTARYKSCDTAAQAIAVLRSGEFGFPVVLKADGLAAGKGVVIAPDLTDAESQVQAMMVDKRFGQAGARLVIEELLVGREASFFVLSDGTRALPLGSAEDHKRALDGDAGPNTGGMGAYAPSSLFDAATQARVMSEIVLPVLEGMRSEGSEFRGFLFVGLMLTADGPKVIEFNVRFGDPEAQVILPMIDDDLSDAADERRGRRARDAARVARRRAARRRGAGVGRLSGHVRNRQGDSRPRGGRGDARRQRVSLGHGEARVGHRDGRRPRVDGRRVGRAIIGAPSIARTRRSARSVSTACTIARTLEQKRFT